MDIEKNKTGVGYDVVFSLDETHLLSAIYGEAINKRLALGNNSSVSENDEYIADQYCARKPMKLSFPTIESLMFVVKDFVDDTQERVAGLASQPPMHANHDAIDRNRYGKRAEDMLEEINEFMDSDSVLPDFEQPALPPGDLPPMPKDFRIPDSIPKDF